ncbi:unnamed protein product [Mesocestoides corti]|uniref:CRAL-TRIO domain-containing protein n=1 Tax=Mesocestoides corti TaxID=53468 RepID=A0A0R3UI38_MESCO|nr:unnamed protein product [Mesocestoides corti]
MSSAGANFEATNPEEFKKMITTFRETMVKKCKPLPGDPDYFTSDLILTDFLRARKYKLDAAIEMLTAAVEWRRQYQPLKVDCQFCHEKPGFHCIRQIGHDKFGRPAHYACFAQASATRNHADDTIAHCVQLLENARLTFKQSATQVVFIFDCTGKCTSARYLLTPTHSLLADYKEHFGYVGGTTLKGMTLPCCNPNLGKKVMHVFANYYPERLGAAIIVNHKSIFQSIWRAIKKFLDPVTANKMMFLKDKQVASGLRDYFDEATAKWLETEIALNRDITEAQLRFWEKPSSRISDHDPRGSPAYIKEFIDTTPPNGYKPHPNITDLQTGKLAAGYQVQLKPTKGQDKIDKNQLFEYGIDSEDVVDDSDSTDF